jgi:hypothetical protein
LLGLQSRRGILCLSPQLLKSSLENLIGEAQKDRAGKNKYASHLMKLLSGGAFEQAADQAKKQGARSKQISDTHRT